MGRLKITDPDCWSRLGITPQELKRLAQVRTLESLEEAKERAKKKFRELAKQLHPDSHDNDRAKEAELMRLSNARDEILSLEFLGGRPSGVPMRPGRGGVTIIMPPNGGVRRTTVYTSTGTGGFAFYSTATTTGNY